MTETPQEGRQAPLTGVASEDAADVARIEGVVERIVYENAETGFFVARLRERGKPGLTTFVGNLAAVSPGDTVRLWGRWVEDARFGRQLRMERYELVLPTTVAGIEKYLGSGLIHGIGPTFAKRLVDAFGVETLRVIDEEPQRLRSVDGIGTKRAAQIREAWARQRAVQNIMVFLQGHGIGVGQAVRIFKRYGDTAVAVLRDNPYRLAEDISGIGFRTADKIAEQLGVAKDSPKRAEAALLYCLDDAASAGHVYLPWKELAATAAELLSLPGDAPVLGAALEAVEERERVVREGEAVYPTRLWVAEEGCGTLLKRLVAARGDDIPIHADKAVEWVEKTQGIALSPEQREAIRAASREKITVITGGPGTGKTTVLKSLLAIFEKKNVQGMLAAPTGRAAKRMEAATGREARTLHRLLEFSPKEGRFLRNESNPLRADLVIVDEVSMVDVQLMHHLLRALPPRTRLILVGDVDQLPSVGPGNVLLDIIAAGAVPVVWLKTVFRQAAESGIIANAHRINRGLPPEFNTRDFFFVERKEPAAALDTIVELVTRRIPGRFGLDPKREIQVLAPMHRGDAGVANLNTALKEALNPGVDPLPRCAFGLGDKVMQLANNYELDVYNGDVGIVKTVDTDLQEAEVQFDDRVVLYGFDQLDELGPAYASTIHKAQGSEYPAVVMPVLTQHYLMLQRNILYTAITRASRLVILVGDPRGVDMAVRNTRVVQRNTRLAERLRNVK